MVDWASGIIISDVPVRKVVGRSSPITNGWARSNKVPQGFCAGESKGELEFVMFAEMDPNITAIRPQPCEVPFTHDDKACIHIPDFAVVERGESHLLEVKSLRQWEKIDLKRRLRSAGRSIEARGWNYHVVIKEDMLSDRRLPQIQAVWRWFRPTYNVIQRLAVEAQVEAGPRLIADVITQLDGTMGENALKFEDILSMAANGAIFIDLDNPIGPETIIRFADEMALPPPLIPRRRPADELPWEVHP